MNFPLYSNWRFMRGDVDGAEAPDFDDSGWERGVCYFKVPLSLKYIWACAQIRQGDDDTRKVWLDNFALYRLWPQ